MAYRRTSRRNRRARKPKNLKKNARRKSLIKLIKSVSYATQETKQYFTSYDPLGFFSPGSAANLSYCHHLWYAIPNAGNTSIVTNNSFIGEQIYVKGVKLRLTPSPGMTTNMMMRVSIISVSDAAVYLSTPEFAVTPPQWYAQDTGNMALAYARRRFNMNKVNVLMSKQIWMRPLGSGYTKPWRNIYVKFNRRFKRRDEETTVNETWGLNKGKDYYAILEYTNLNGTAIVGNMGMNYQAMVYFKDA